MSEVVGYYHQLAPAFLSPTLKLLDSKWAPMRAAILRGAFSQDRPSIPVEQLHSQVEVFLGELSSVGVEPPPNSTGRSLCSQFMNEKWLSRSNGPSGEEYSMTSHALEALSIAGSMTRSSLPISESKINTILQTARQVAREADPDTQSKIGRLNSEIKELELKRDRLALGDDSSAPNDEQMLEMYLNLQDQIRDLPSDFVKVSEAVLKMHASMLKEFREEARPIGEVIDVYLKGIDDLLTSTPEGRAFAAAFVVLRNEDVLSELKENIATILAHQFAQNLSPSERREIRATPSTIRQGTEEVLASRRKISASLRTQIMNYDVAAEKELDKTLRAIDKELYSWMESAKPRDGVEIELLPGSVNLIHLREKFHNFESDEPIAPLSNEEPVVQLISLEDIKKQGGPSLAEMRKVISTYVESGKVVTLGEIFNAMDASSRRPVEALGILHLAIKNSAFTITGEEEMFETVRADGTYEIYSVPLLTLTNLGSNTQSAKNGSTNDN